MKPKLYHVVGFINLITFSLYLYSFTNNENRTLNLNSTDKIIKVRGIVVVDSLGIERVIIGSHLPEPNFSTGNRIAGRGKIGSVSGVMLYDSEGQERGGYVTDDYYGNAFLTLDSKTSQNILLLSEPQGSSVIQLWSRNGKNKVTVSTGDDDATIELKRGGNSVKLYEDEK